MSVALDKKLATSGTKFRIFPQPRFLEAFKQPETLFVSAPAGSLLPGPEDERMVVVDAVNKLPYNQFSGPPYLGQARPKVPPGPGGHFDHLDPDSREFSCATMYATVRRVLDIWEDYFGHRIDWHFASSFEKLELIPLIEWDNAQSGFGFLEFGFGRTINNSIDHSRPYCQNFDVLAHELGHSIIFAQVGVPSSRTDPAIDYGGMHESAGDLVAIVASLHFNTVVDHLLQQTKGNLFTVNELDRVGELSDSREIRVAFNSLRMSDVDEEPHERSIPLTGAIFDVMVEVYQKELVAKSLITQDLADRSTQGPTMDPDVEGVQAEFKTAYAGNEKAFKDALLVARDYLGRLLARTWDRLNPDFLAYHDILRMLMRSDNEMTQGKNQATIRSCFAWREITVPPGSLLLRPHTVRKCGLDGGRADAAAAIAAAMAASVKAKPGAGSGSSQRSVEDALRTLVASLQESVRPGDGSHAAPKQNGPKARKPKIRQAKATAAARRPGG
jgi:hypothetical protein